MIECLPWAEFVERYDSPTTIFYLDPPYWGSETDYGAGVFTRADFVRLAVRLSAIAGRFMLSVNDVPQTREIFARFRVESVATRYTIAGGNGFDVTDIIVTGPSSHDVMPPAPPDLLSLTCGRLLSRYKARAIKSSPFSENEGKG